ncbi:MAG TPA: hypothetical protein ENI93_06930 [Gammaproteobacteria bacterium]|nr:hypothetical protein [Gammaproteobacteria bacterium]
MKPNETRPSAYDDGGDRPLRYSLIELRKDGEPFLEVLQDDMPLADRSQGSGDHFRLNAVSARMLLTVLREIRQFVRSGGMRPVTESPQGVSSRLWQCECTIERVNGGGCGNERHVEPYLRIVCGDERLDIGLDRARAILFLETDIEYFVLRHF